MSEENVIKGGRSGYIEGNEISKRRTAGSYGPRVSGEWAAKE
jgi:hypothetical protein